MDLLEVLRDVLWWVLSLVSTNLDVLAVLLSSGAFCVILVYMVSILVSTLVREHSRSSPQQSVILVQIIPFVTWLVSLPIMLVAIVNIGDIAENVNGSVSTKYLLTSTLIHVSILTTFTAFICGFARSFYTITLLDGGQWWEVRGFNRVFTHGPNHHRIAEGLIRFAIIATFIIHQINITNIMMLGQPSDTASQIQFFQAIEEVILRFMNHFGVGGGMAVNQTDNILNSGGWGMVGVTGMIVFALIYLWSKYVETRFVNAPTKAQLSELEKTTVLDNFKKQRWICGTGFGFSLYILVFLLARDAEYLMVFSILAIIASMIFLNIVRGQVVHLVKSAMVNIRNANENK